MAKHLLQSSYIPSISHTVNRKRVSEGVGMYVFSDDITIALDDSSHLSLFDGKYGLIIGEVLCGNVSGEHFKRFLV